MEQQGVRGQRLLFSETIQLTPRDADWIRQNLATLRRMGIELEEFGADTFKLTRELREHGFRVLGSTIVGLEHHTKENMVDEIEQGVEGTDIRAGFIGEIGTDRYHITPAQERVFRAAARAQRRTGVSIWTHTTHFGELALEQIALLCEEDSVPRSRVVISHMGDRRDFASHPVIDDIRTQCVRRAAIARLQLHPRSQSDADAARRSAGRNRFC